MDLFNRQKKKAFWDATKNSHRHWLAANMNNEAFLGFGAFNTKKITGRDTADFIKFRQNIAQSRVGDMGCLPRSRKLHVKLLENYDKALEKDDQEVHPG